VNLMLLFGEPDDQTGDSSGDAAEGGPSPKAEASGATRPPDPPDPGPH